MFHNGSRTRFSTKELIVYSPILLGILLWISSLFLPAVAEEGENLYGLQMLFASIVVPLNPPSLLKRSIFIMSIASCAMHFLMLTALAMWLGLGARHVVIMRLISTILILGAFALGAAGRSLFKVADVGFYAWVNSFFCVGAGLLGYSVFSKSKILRSGCTGL
jgi:hypothetical protein